MLAAALLCGSVSALPALDSLRGLSLDALTALRWTLFGARHDPSSSPVVVIAIDEETYRTPPLKGSPTLTWTGEIGRVLNAVLAGGASVVGFDLVFPTSIEQSGIPFGEEALGARLRGFDRDWLRALAAGAGDGRLVLGEVLRSDEPIRPAAGQRVAVRQQRNIRALNVFVDIDGVVRRVPLTFAAADRPIPAMALELAARAWRAEPQIGEDGAVSLGSYRIPSIVPNTMALNFDGGGADIPTYSFGDLRACAEKGDAAFFNRAFAGKVVLFGTVLEAEDRKLTSKRFATGDDRVRAARCATAPPVQPPGDFTRASIAGVYIHATAVNNLLRHDAVRELPRWVQAVAGILFALLGACAARLLSPGVALLAWAGFSVAWTLIATLVFLPGLALPLIPPLLAALVALILMIGFRFVIADRGERLLRASFSLYLAPHVIEQMVASSKPPVLGGETREVTVFFSDLAGFSAIAETLSPDGLVRLMNDYLSAMTDVIEAHGGYVDKYIGDSIVAVFGAPVDDPDHARHAALAALGCRDRLAELNVAAQAFQGRQLVQRMGLNSGPALVGNIGSRRRFNYSVMGDVVNVASRLEGANKFYGTTIIASEQTMASTGEGLVWRELDSVRVMGRSLPLRIFELVGPSAEVGDADRSVLASYAEGLAHWRAGEFAQAARSFSATAEHDTPSAKFVQRADAMVAAPPGPGWEPVNTLDSK